MHILLMGDFSGRAGRGAPASGSALAERAIVSVDVDDLDGVLLGHAPRLDLQLPDAGPAVALEFRCLEDFHPDRLYERLELFRAFKRTRARLLDPATFAEEAAGLRGPMDRGPVQPPAGAGDQAREELGTTLERLLGRPPAQAPRSPRSVGSGGADLGAFLRRVVAPHVVPAVADEQQSLVGAVEQALAEQMRALLHQPAFQALESVWRGTEWLVTGLETGEDLNLFVVDVTKDELAADLGAARHELAASGLQRLLVDRGAGMLGGHSWSLLVGDYAFGTGSEDTGLLEQLGAIAREAGGPFLAAADPSLLGIPSAPHTPDPEDWQPLDAAGEAAWRSLRTSSVAPWVGLAFPRLLLRLPYGARTDSIDAFAFEELSSPDPHDKFLWGNPAFGCAWLLGKSFRERAWEMEPGDLLYIGDLPSYAYEERGEARLKPCAEAFLSDRAADAILARGIMPVRSYANRNAAQLVRFQSLADPPQALAGP
jgi:type VI secretion system protein ImpC